MDPDAVVSRVQATLGDLIEEFRNEERPYLYGFAIHPRLDDGQLGFGVITIGGESLPLTRAMIDALGSHICWIYGELPAQVTLGGGPSAGDGPVPCIEVSVLNERGFDPQTRALYATLGTVTPGELKEVLVALTTERPDGWPQ